MKKINKKEIKEITEKLKPFWKKYVKIQNNFYKKIRNLQEEMNKKVRNRTNLEFFYVDGECVGIGAERYSDRKHFPLIHDRELM
ncbi:MAG: hypothetical protein WCP89_03405 [archaeon]